MNIYKVKENIPYSHSGRIQETLVIASSFSEVEKKYTEACSIELEIKNVEILK